jgi:hypothetical protein
MNPEGRRGKGPPNASPRSKSRSKSAEKQKAAFQMRVAGASFRQICEALKCSMGCVSAMLDRELDEIKAETRQHALKLRDLELSRLDRMQVAIWEDALRGDLRAIDRVLSIQRRRADLIGLDAPKEVNLGGMEGGAPITIELVREVVPSGSRPPSQPDA